MNLVQQPSGWQYQLPGQQDVPHSCWDPGQPHWLLVQVKPGSHPPQSRTLPHAFDTTPHLPYAFDTTPHLPLHADVGTAEHTHVLPLQVWSAAQPLQVCVPVPQPLSTVPHLPPAHA